jgi:hypothetical protein
MTRRRAPHIPQRRPVYIGCEGASEFNYAGFLQDLLREAGLPVHLVVEELGPGAGDPLARVEMAVRRLAHLRRTRTAPAERFVLLDFDQAERDPQRADLARRTAAEADIVIVWQRPCFEAVLLRHLQGRAGHRPPDTPRAGQALVRDWPEYEKPMTRADLARRLDLAAVLRAAVVEPELEALLSCLGIL